ncbi:MAG: PAS domain S-box protein [Candidatus Sabulitectum sp.]|nr:PAS domain S-box protein [Candidatus Sabulitectum sp.]
MSDKEELLDIVLDNTYVSYLRVDGCGQITEVHQSTADLLGLSMASVKGMQLLNLFPELSLEEESPQTFSFNTNKKTRVDISATVVPAEDSGRHIIVQDVTELTSTREELCSVKGFLEIVKNSTPHIIILKDPDGKWLDWNKKAGSYLTSLELSDNEIPHLSPACSTSDADAWSTDGYVRIDEKLTDGQVYDVVKIAVRNEDGTPRHMLVMARDITDRSIREQRIKKLNSIVGMLRSVDRLIYEASDVNTLLEHTVGILTDSGVFSCSAIHYARGRDEVRFSSDSSSMPSESTIVSSLEYRGISYGSLLALPSESESSDGVSELTGILAELAGDIGFAIHGLQLASERDQTANMLNSFLENIPGIAFIRDSRSRYLRMNKIILEFFDKPDWIGKDPEKLYSPEVYENLIKRDQEVLENGYICRERIFKDTDGEERVFEGHYFKIQMPGGEPLIGGIGLEITDRLGAERALAESEERYRTIYESTVTAMALLGPDGGVVSANSNVVELTGFSLEEIVGKMTWVDFVHPEDLQSVAEQRKKRLAGDSSEHQEYEFRLIRKDGAVRSIRMRTGTIHNSGGMGVISLSDITSLIDYQKQLNQSLNKMQAILEAIPDLMFVLSREGKYLDFYAGDENKLYYGPDEIADKGIFDIDLPGTTADEMLATIVSTLETRQVSNVAYELDLPDGHHYYEAGIAPFEADSVLVLCRDVTLRKIAEAEQIRLQAQVQHVQKLESLGVLAGGIAHDFNNILMAISGNVQLAVEVSKTRRDVTKYLEAIEVATSRAADLTGQMLAYSGRGEFRIAPLNLNAVVDEISDMLRVTVSKKAVMRFDLSENLPLILADATQAGQVFMNLITNASEALDNSPGTIDICTGVIYCDDKYIGTLERLDELSVGNYVYMEVKDSGEGMSAEVKTSIFNPFFTTKFTGRGLGLSAVLGIMSSHNGALEIESTPGEGSTFRALFPVITGDSYSSPEPSKTRSDSLKMGGTVMFVDDEPLVRDVVETMLNQFGLNVISAVDGLDCLNKFKENILKVDLVILDITMPNMDGDEAFREMKKLRSDIPVIISSGYSEHEVIARFPDEYPDGFLQKPYSADELQSKIRAVLKQ